MRVSVIAVSALPGPAVPSHSIIRRDSPRHRETSPCHSPAEPRLAVAALRSTPSYLAPPLPWSATPCRCSNSPYLALLRFCILYAGLRITAVTGRILAIPRYYIQRTTLLLPDRTPRIGTSRCHCSACLERRCVALAVSRAAELCHCCLHCATGVFWVRWLQNTPVIDIDSYTCLTLARSFLPIRHGDILCHGCAVRAQLRHRSPCPAIAPLRLALPLLRSELHSEPLLAFSAPGIAVAKPGHALPLRFRAMSRLAIPLPRVSEPRPYRASPSAVVLNHAAATRFRAWQCHTEPRVTMPMLLFLSAPSLLVHADAVLYYYALFRLAPLCPRDEGQSGTLQLP